MAVDADDAGAGHLAARWGHHAPALLASSIGAVVIMGLRPPPEPFALVAPPLVLAVVLVSWVLMRRHDRRLCEQCAASMPLNPAELAARQQRRLWVAHAGSQPRFMLPYLAVLIGSNFATAPGMRLGWALIQMTMIYLILCYTSHRRLQPWCPWCRGDGGGEDRDDVTPPPPVDQRQLT